MFKGIVQQFGDMPILFLAKRNEVNDVAKQPSETSGGLCQAKKLS